MWISDSGTQANWLAGAAIAVATVSPVQAADKYAIGICQIARQSMGARIEPISDGNSYLYTYRRNEAIRKGFDYRHENTRITLIKAPKHGEVALADVPDVANGQYHYTPSEGYLGQDRFVMQVEKDGVRVRIYYLIEVLDEIEPETGICRQDTWKISTATPDNPALASVLATAGQTLTFANLAGSAVGQTTGSGTSARITLDPAAAGHGWYIDPTPLNNSDDYLPTADEGVWMARPSSAAEGKMDLLSVLLHEYGHVLGLEHSANGKDFMGPVLPPGMRKLPTAAELQQMADLVAQLRAPQDAATADAATGSNGSPTAPTWPLNLPFMAMGAVAWVRRRDGGEAADALLPNTPLNLARAQDQWAINASLQNPLFAPDQTLAGGNSLQAWGTSGKYLLDTAAGSITLQEDSRQQTQVSQAFQLGAQDRFLRFTVNDGNLRVNGPSTGAGGPQDAFEIALLDAVTGQSLFGTIDASRTDALVNTQRDAAGTLGDTPPRPLDANARPRHPLQSPAMFAARPFALNTATASLAGMAARAITTKITTITG